MIMGKKMVKVCWLEDEKILQVLLKEILHESGWLERLQIQWVENGTTALEILSATAPDLFVTDLAHPGVDGEELLRELAAKKVKYPILVLSGFPDGQEKKFRADGKKKFPNLKISVMGKPFEPQELIKKLCAMLRAKR